MDVAVMKSGAGKLGFAGVVCGLLAISVVVLHFFLGPIEQPQTLEDVFAETTIKLKDAIEIQLHGEGHGARSLTRELGPDKIVDYAVIIFGLLASVLGVLSFVKHEDGRAAGAALLLGVGAIVLQYVVAAA